MILEFFSIRSLFPSVELDYLLFRAQYANEMLMNNFKLFSYEYKYIINRGSIKNGERHCGLIIERLIAFNETNCCILRSNWFKVYRTGITNVWERQKGRGKARKFISPNTSCSCKFEILFLSPDILLRVRFLRRAYFSKEFSIILAYENFHLTTFRPVRNAVKPNPALDWNASLRTALEWISV